MSDDLKQTGKPDNSRINVEQIHEVKYWANKFGVSPDALRSAVQKAGPMVKDVRSNLASKRNRRGTSQDAKSPQQEQKGKTAFCGAAREAADL